MMRGVVSETEWRGVEGAEQWAKVRVNFGAVEVVAWIRVPDGRYAFAGQNWAVGLIRPYD